jgi:hypothetical protein
MELILPQNWESPWESPQSFDLDPSEKNEFLISFKQPIKTIKTSNKIQLQISVQNSSTSILVHFVLVGGFRWLVSKVAHEINSLKTKSTLEKDRKRKDMGNDWTPISWSDYSLPIESFFDKQSGSIYLRHYIYSPSKRVIRIGVPNNNQMKLWLNGHKIMETRKIVPLRPNYGGDGSNYITAKLNQGWNQVMIKLLRGETPIDAHFILSYNEDKRGMEDLIECHFPWEE